MSTTITTNDDSLDKSFSKNPLKNRDMTFNHRDFINPFLFIVVLFLSRNTVHKKHFIPTLPLYSTLQYLNFKFVPIHFVIKDYKYLFSFISNVNPSVLCLTTPYDFGSHNKVKMVYGTHVNVWPFELSFLIAHHKFTNDFTILFFYCHLTGIIK